MKFVEYNNTVLVVPIIFSAARNKNVANPVPKSPKSMTLGSCLKSIWNGTLNPTIAAMTNAAPANEVNCVILLGSIMPVTYLHKMMSVAQNTPDNKINRLPWIMSVTDKWD